MALTAMTVVVARVTWVVLTGMTVVVALSHDSSGGTIV